jgi:hypothetical protein
LLYIALGAGLLWLLLWSQGVRPILKYPQWRIASAVLATSLFAVAAFLGIRGQWGKAIVLLVLGLWLVSVSRLPRSARPAAEPALDRMSVNEAYAILDLQPGATREEVQAAYTRLMKLVHPDKGGGAGLAAKLNAARDRLLKG